MQSNAPHLHEASLVATNQIYKKITIKIVPFLFICYVINFLDRINISFANLTMKPALGFTEAVYGLAAGAFAIGYVIFELPSNLLLDRLGARKTFCRIMVLWGLASCALIFVRHPTEFYAIRFLLGCFEAGFFPGIVLYLTYWYPQARRAGVLSWFFVGVAIAGLVGGLISGFIIENMHGLWGLSGWQWMFVVEALPAILLGIAAYFYLSDSPEQVSWLSDTEKSLITRDLQEDSLLNRHKNSHSFRSALSDWRVYALSFVYFCLVCGSFVIAFWLPTIIKQSGVKDVLHVSLYSAIPYGIGILGIIGISRHSDKTEERRWHYALCSIVGALAIHGMTLKGLSLPALLGIASIAVFLVYAAIPVFWTIPTVFLHGTAAAGGIALISSIGMVGGFVSPYIIGLLTDTTGSLGVGIDLMASLLAISGVLVFMIIPATKTSSPSLTAGAAGPKS